MALIQPNPNGQATSANSAPVVIASDQSAVSVNAAGSLVSATTLQNAATATGNGSTISVAGMTTAVLTVSGITSATIVVEATDATGAYQALRVKTLGTNTVASSIAAAGIYIIHVAGFSLLRARISAYSSGTITATASATAANNHAEVQPVAMSEQLDSTNDAISSWERGWTYTKVTASALVSSTACLVGGYTVEASSSGTLTLYNNTAASGDTIGANGVSLTANTQVFFHKPIICTTGLYATIGGTSATVNVLTRNVSK